MRARDNPFATDRLHALRYRPQGVTWPDILARLAAMDYRAAIVGPEGSGKTTLLAELGERLQQAGFRINHASINDTSPSMPADFCHGPDTILLLDGADHLSYLRWLWVNRRSRRSAGLVITMHRPGRLPTLVQCATSVALLADLVGELTAGAAESITPQLAQLYQAHGGNIRTALRDLYDRSAGL